MALPEHKYYTLKQAAKKAGCEVEDLIHFAAIGVLELCFRVPENGYPSDDGSWFYPIEIQPIDLSGASKFAYKSDYLSVMHVIPNSSDDYIPSKIRGFLAVSWEWIQMFETELMKGGDLSISDDFFSPPRTDKISSSDGDFFAFVDIPQDEEGLVDICVKLDDLFITACEMKLLQTGGRPVKSQFRPVGHNEVRNITRERLHQNQFLFIHKLLKHIGFSDEEIFGPVSKMKQKIASMGINFPDKNTWSKWVDKMNRK